MVLNKANAQRDYGYCGGYQPFVRPAKAAPHADNSKFYENN